MALQDFTFKGKKLEELTKLDIKEFAELLPSRQKRTLKRGLTEQQKKLLEKVSLGKPVKTHCRNMVVVPQMIGKRLLVYNGKTFEQVIISEEMLGHYLGEFALTRKKVEHSAPGVGATKSSASVSVK